MDTTIDGYEVRPGLAVWDYDLNRARVVGPQKYQNPAEPVWYEMQSVDGSRPSKMMDAKRMWYRHPSTGAIAENIDVSEYPEGSPVSGERDTRVPVSELDDWQ